VEPILSGEIRCPVHLCSGEEAIAAGICAALGKEDHIFGNHRSHGHYLAKGGGMKELVAEVFCKQDGCSKGRGGSMHLIDPENGMLGSAPIVAGTIPLALGAALAFAIRKEKRVAVSFFGDGATGEGVLCESLNFAALKKLPIIFVCENNLYSTHLPIDEIRVSRDIFKIAQPFGEQTFRVDGNDAIKVHGAALKAVAACRDGRGPVFLECLTYRLRGHVGPDDNVQGSHTDIRPPEEIELWRKRDPIRKMRRYLLRNRLASPTELQTVQDRVTLEVSSAHAFARASQFPAAEEVANHVFK
jgi:acetoin:2,6-dichlorophenolindophenol oxidoreductase subunit alpha